MVIEFSLVSLLMEILVKEPVKLERIELNSWQDAAIFVLPTEPDPVVEEIVQKYIKGLSARGVVARLQGLWIQSDWTELAEHQGKVPVSAASLTKIATTLAVLSEWNLDYQFETKIYTNGPIKDGILQGDLLIEGSGDPFFLFRDAIAAGNALNELGIDRVTGNLIITGNFYLNYNSNPKASGKLFQQALNEGLWSRVMRSEYKNLPEETPRPQVAIAGSIRVQDSIPNDSVLLSRHLSLNLAQILKQMNIYSNNELSQMLANSIGGAKAVSQLSASAAGVPLEEIQLINGSGLGVDNRISPRAVCAMLMAIDRKLLHSHWNIVDLFPVAGRDRSGTMVDRNIPDGITVKTGTLWQVSALAGMIPTTERGPIWFAIINHQGDRIGQFRAQQDKLLQRLSQHWQVISNK